MVSIDDFHEAFSKAEEDIKLAELSISRFSSEEDVDCAAQNGPRGIVIPSINELRYAAKHLSDAMRQDKSSQGFEEQIRRAIRHCIRARLDALKATILFFVRNHYSFDQDYRLASLPESGRKMLNEYREKIQVILSQLSQDHSESTNEECDLLKSKIEELRIHYLDLESKRDHFNQLLLVAEMRNHSVISTRQWTVGIACTIIGTIVGTISGYILGKFF